MGDHHLQGVAAAPRPRAGEGVAVLLAGVDDAEPVVRVALAGVDHPTCRLATAGSTFWSTISRTTLPAVPLGYNLIEHRLPDYKQIN